MPAKFKSSSGQSTQTGGAIQDFPNISASMQGVPGAIDTNSAYQRWWQQVKYRLVTTQQGNQQTLFSISQTVTLNNQTLTASITSLASAIARSDGYLESSYSLTATAGAVVTGMSLFSASGPGTNISKVVFQADVFQIWNGSTGVEMFDVSGSKVTLAGTLVTSTNGKVYIGAGNYSNADTGFYVDSTSRFSLGSNLTWDGASALSVNGSLTSISGTIGGFTLASNSLTAGSGATMVQMSTNIALGVVVGDIGASHVTLRSAAFSPGCFVYNPSAQVVCSLQYAAGSSRGLCNVNDGTGTSYVELRGDTGSILMTGSLTSNLGLQTVGAADSGGVGFRLVRVPN